MFPRRFRHLGENISFSAYALHQQPQQNGNSGYQGYGYQYQYRYENRLPPIPAPPTPPSRDEGCSNGGRFRGDREVMGLERPPPAYNPDLVKLPKYTPPAPKVVVEKAKEDGYGRGEGEERGG